MLARFPGVLVKPSKQLWAEVSAEPKRDLVPSEHSPMILGAETANTGTSSLSEEAL